MSENQGKASQFTELEKKMLLDGGWQCSFCKSVYEKNVENCDFCGHSRKDSDLHRLGLFTEADEAAADAPAQAAIPDPAAVPEAASAPEPASTPEAVTAPEPAFVPEAAAVPEPAAPQPMPEAVPQPAVMPDSMAEPELEFVPMPEVTVAPQSEQPSPQNKFIYADTDLGEQEQEIINDGGWQCGFCRRINAYIITSCACGHNRDDSDLKHLGKYVDPEEEYEEEDYDEDEYEEDYDDGEYEGSEEPEMVMTEQPIPEPVAPQPVPQPVPVPAPRAVPQPAPTPQPVPQTAPQAAPIPQPVPEAAQQQPVQQPTPQPAMTAETVIPQPAATPQNDSPFVDFSEEELVSDTENTPAAQPQAAPAPQPMPEAAMPQQPAAQSAPTPQPVPQAVPEPQPVPQPVPQQPAASEPQDDAMRKETLEQQIMEDLRKNNFSDVAIVRANRKYKEMVKRGIMTQEEFNQKIHELLPVEEEESPEENENPEQETANE